MTALCAAAERIEESKQYLGNGTYRHDAVHLTEVGLAAGWVYCYPMGISKHGINVYRLGLTLQDLIENGYAAWHSTTTTCV